MTKIVILGAGFGGLTAALELGRKIKNGKLKDCELTLVDKNSYHTYTPTLYEAATTSKETANYIGIRSIVTFPLDEILKGLPIRIVDDEALSVEAGAKTAVRLKNGLNRSKGSVGRTGSQEPVLGEKLEYDYLVLALGSVTNYFGIPGLEEAALKMKTFNHSMEIREAVWSEVAMNEVKKPLKIVIGGGGSTGVELAGELRVWLNQLGKKRKRETQVSIIEANPTVLFGFDERVVRTVTARLIGLGVKLMTGKAIKSVSVKDKKISLEGEDIDYDILIWTGGVKANPILETLPIKMEKGRAGVAQGMACMPPEKSDLSSGIKMQKIFAIGDMVCFIDPKTSRPVPLVAEAAINQGLVAAKNIEMEIKGRPHVFYNPGDFPYVIPIGGKYAVAKWGPFIIKGFLGWILKGLVELKYLFSIMPFFKAMKIWLKGLMIFVKNDRLG